MRDALRKDVALFKQVPAQSAYALRVLMHQEVPDSDHDVVCLLPLGLHRNEAHARPARRFTSGLT
jgi:hypothetical protein